MMTDDEIIEVVQAHKSGKTIEAKQHGVYSWLALPAWAGNLQRWDFPNFDYRVKPEPPRTIWVYEGNIEICKLRDRSTAMEPMIQFREVLP